MNEQTFTHKCLAGLLGLSETTIKSYRRKFPGCIPVASQGKPIRFTAKALDVATRIRDLFETGMSIDEVRSRLVTDFDFISPHAPESQPDKYKKTETKTGDRLEVSPELSMGVSNMAKSMVAMTQQQKAILGRMQHLEAIFEKLGLAGFTEGAGQVLGKAAQAVREREGQIEERLNQLDQNTRDLAVTVQALAGQLERFLGHRAEAAEAWKASSVETLHESAVIAGQTLQKNSVAAESGGMDERLRQPASQEMTNVFPLRGETVNLPRMRTAPEHASGYTDAPSTEPPRQFFTLPLVARTEQGKYISAGGRNRGRLSLNDLKALLVYGFTPPNHFTLRWERHGQGWWLHLEQETHKRAVQLLLMELPSQKGGSVVEVIQIVSDKETLHPAEFCVLIDSFGA